MDVLFHQIVSFCLPKSEIMTAHSNLADALACGDTVLVNQISTRLHERARSLFIKAKKGSHRSGEAGEILLFILVEWLLKAPQIVSKMYLKTNNNMPVHGTDGIHARFDDSTKRLHLYWGESKAHNSLGGAFISAMKSIKDFHEEGGQNLEIPIVSNFSDFNTASPDAKEAFIRYLDPYNEEYNQCVTSFACLLVFDFPFPIVGDIDIELCEKEFVNAANVEMHKFLTSLPEKLADRNIGHLRFEFFLVPVPSAQEFRDKFQSRIGWPND
ncbi:DUF1837 domain-containing protein [Paracoccus sp. EF6]|uniref:DUF1837 domain-containing protein n=1 Tax=Paracoccus benzoatiresistens TaxID=2997341 RepID=A0ABT4J3V9_9RHOB|nr:DUF1837 domain-containing protein [Paracoccus sp. EF6]